MLRRREDCVMSLGRVSNGCDMAHRLVDTFEGIMCSGTGPASAVCACGGGVGGRLRHGGWCRCQSGVGEKIGRLHGAERLNTRVGGFGRYCFLVTPFCVMFSMFIVTPVAVTVLLDFASFGVLRFPDMVNFGGCLALFFRSSIFLVTLGGALVFTVVANPVDCFTYLFFT